MKTKVINGADVAKQVLAQVKQDIEALKQRGITPGLAVVLVGMDPASKVYVGAKARKCLELGMYSLKIELSAEATQEEVLKVIDDLNNNDDIHGILVQSPPPKHIDEQAVVRAIRPDKDVDGFHPENIAKLVLEDETGFVPCTPAGCMCLLASAGVVTEGARAVVLGRSMIVGKPMAHLLMGKKSNATVTIAHSRTKDLPALCRQADIIIAAIGKPEFVTKEFIKEGAVVIDVGINRIADATSERGYKLVGDVDYASVAPYCAAITPVPGGVGPMTIALLMANTVKAARQLNSK